MADSIDTVSHTAITALVNEFSYLIDHGEARSIPNLFTENGTFESPQALLESREAIAAAMVERAQVEYETRHVITNLRITIASSDEIHGTAMLMLYRWTPGGENSTCQPVALAEYHDVYQRNAEGDWQFASRKALPLLPASE